MRTTNAVVACVLLICAVHAAEAQQKPAATLSGVVRDVLGAPVANARVEVAGLKKRANTDTAGRYFIRQLPVGEDLHIFVARLGFRPVHVVLLLRAGENPADVELEPVPQRLDAMRTEVEQGGLFGVVGDTAFDVIAGARATLVSRSSGDRLTNELGQFAMDTVSPGPNMLQVVKPGFRPRIMSFLHPPKGGTRVAVWMTPLPPGANMRESQLPNRTLQALFDLRARTRWRNASAAIITRELLTKYGTGMRLDQAIERMPAQYTRGVRTFKLQVTIEGDAMPTLTLADFNADDVEMVELYPAGSNLYIAMRAGRGMRRTNPEQSISAARGEGRGSEPPPEPVGTAWVWLRR